MWRGALAAGFGVFCEAVALTAHRSVFVTAVMATLGGVYLAASFYLVEVYRP